MNDLNKPNKKSKFYNLRKLNEEIKNFDEFREIHGGNLRLWRKSQFMKDS